MKGSYRVKSLEIVNNLLEEIEIHTKLTTYTNPKEFKIVKQWLEENKNV